MEKTIVKHPIHIVGWFDHVKIMKTFFLHQPMTVEYRISNEAAADLGMAPQGEIRIYWFKITSVEKMFVLDGRSPSGIRVRCWYEIGKPHCRTEVSALS